MKYGNFACKTTFDSLKTIENILNNKRLMNQYIYI